MAQFVVNENLTDCLLNENECNFKTKSAVGYIQKIIGVIIYDSAPKSADNLRWLDMRYLVFLVSIHQSFNFFVDFPRLRPPKVYLRLA